jgi:hypothetical protein
VPAPLLNRRRLLLLLLACGLVVVALGLLALPLRSVADDADAARTYLQDAKEAIEAGDINRAQAAVQDARAHVNDVQGAVQGIGGDVWSVVPVVGGSVRDVRRLGSALDDLTAVAELGVATWPTVSGDDATLFDGSRVDLPTLERVTQQVRAASTRLDSARAELEGVADHRPLVGARLAEARDQALDQVVPLSSGIDTLDPVLDVLPQILGGTDSRKYVLALLNPAELLYSGGTPQTFSTISLDQGRLRVGPALDLFTNAEFGEPRYWRRVPGNPFHRGQLRPALATMAPDWSVAGEELANAWRSARGRRMSGVIAIDVVALSDLVALTGPVTLPGVGTLTTDNMVETLIGSYDRYADNAARKRLNRALAPVFADRLLAGDPADTLRSLADAAAARRFAMFFRNDDEQAAFDELRLTGRLGRPEQDYLGVFTQNAVPSKSDYWQRRTVRSEVWVRRDGSARVRLRVAIHNDSPPYAQPGVDPGEGYFTRHNTVSVLTMIPGDARIVRGSLDRDPIPIQQGTFFEHAFQRHTVALAPQQVRELEIDYVVQRAARREDDGTLRYRLVLDPQGMVIPQETHVVVRFPAGFEASSVPVPWQVRGERAAVYATSALTRTESFEITASP